MTDIKLPENPAPAEREALARSLARDLAPELLHEIAQLLATPFAQSREQHLKAQALAAAERLREDKKSERERRFEQRFWARVKKGADDECWIWTATRARGGYGVFSVDNDRVLAHRWSYEHATGPIPLGWCILHSCDVPACVNPAHLRAGTEAENVADKISRRRHQYGEHHPNARLTFAQVGEIRASTESQASLARRFGVSKNTINNIFRGRSWKLTNPPPGADESKSHAD